MRGDRRGRFWGRLGAGTMRGHRLEWRLRWGMEWGGGETVFFFFSCWERRPDAGVSSVCLIHFGPIFCLVFFFFFSQLCIRERDGFATDLEQDEASMSSLGKNFGGDLFSFFITLLVQGCPAEFVQPFPQTVNLAPRRFQVLLPPKKGCGSENTEYPSPSQP